MSASHPCHARGYPRARFLALFALLMGAHAARSGEDATSTTKSGCDLPGVLEHILGQFRHYGPRSDDHEYFGFIYRLDGEIASAVTRGTRCNGTEGCVTNTRFAAQRVPKGSKVLGEWHTHPLAGSRQLTLEDVRGANNNAGIRCYVAYYSAPDGEIYAWDPRSTSVPAAMSTRSLVGQYGLRDSPAVADVALRAGKVRPLAELPEEP